MRSGAFKKFAVFLLCSLVCACGANEGILKSGKDNVVSTNSAPVQSTLEKDVDAMRTANFKFIYVLRRKDAGVMDAEDRGAIKLQTDGANRRISSDNDKAFVIGSNFEIPGDKMMAIYDRFAVENYSPPGNVNNADNANVK